MQPLKYERNEIEDIAKGLDTFAYNFDHYNYQDSQTYDNDEVASLVSLLESGNTVSVVKYLEEVIEEGDYMVDEAKALLSRIKMLRGCKHE